MMLFQLALAFAGTYAFVASGYTGPNAGFIGLLCAVVGTMIVVKFQNRRTKRQRPALDDEA